MARCGTNIKEIQHSWDAPKSGSRVEAVFNPYFTYFRKTERESVEHKQSQQKSNKYFLNIQRFFVKFDFALPKLPYCSLILPFPGITKGDKLRSVENSQQCLPCNLAYLNLTSVLRCVTEGRNYTNKTVIYERAVNLETLQSI